MKYRITCIKSSVDEALHADPTSHFTEYVEASTKTEAISKLHASFGYRQTGRSGEHNALPLVWSVEEVRQ
jgi:hypothetical protein